MDWFNIYASVIYQSEIRARLYSSSDFSDEINRVFTHGIGLLSDQQAAQRRYFDTELSFGLEEFD